MKTKYFCIIIFPQVIITSSGDEKAELSQKILDVLYATEVLFVTLYTVYTLTFKPCYNGT